MRRNLWLVDVDGFGSQNMGVIIPCMEMTYIVNGDNALSTSQAHNGLIWLQVRV